MCLLWRCPFHSSAVVFRLKPRLRMSSSGATFSSHLPLIVCIVIALVGVIGVVIIVAVFCCTDSKKSKKETGAPHSSRNKLGKHAKGKHARSSQHLAKNRNKLASAQSQKMSKALLTASIGNTWHKQSQLMAKKNSVHNVSRKKSYSRAGRSKPKSSKASGRPAPPPIDPRIGKMDPNALVTIELDQPSTSALDNNSQEESQLSLASDLLAHTSTHGIPAPSKTSLVDTQQQKMPAGHHAKPTRRK